MDKVFVIVHGKRTFFDREGKVGPMYLGQFGWKGALSQAQQFVSETEAKLAINLSKRDVPLMWYGAEPEVRAIKTELLLDAGSMAHDYDPFAGLNA